MEAWDEQDSIALGKDNSVFQAEIYAILAVANHV